jgi:hypothetical protein
MKCTGFKVDSHLSVTCEWSASSISVPILRCPTQNIVTCILHKNYSHIIAHWMDGTDTELTRYWLTDDVRLTLKENSVKCGLAVNVDSHISEMWIGFKRPLTLLSNVSVPYQWHVSSVSVPSVQCAGYELTVFLKYIRRIFCAGHRTDGTDMELALL